MSKRSKASFDYYSYGLTEEYESLFEDICFYVGSNQVLFDNDTKIKKWEGRVFRDFILRQKDSRSKIEDAIKYSSSISCNFSTFDKCKDSGIGVESAKRIFCVSAKIHRSSVNDYIDKYIKYCDEDYDNTFKQEIYKKYNNEHRAFRRNSSLIKKIREKNSSENINKSSHCCPVNFQNNTA